ncbi:DUF2188 domain-containing protein [Microbacterium sp.]|uniref:DUF2188 domain-containing protein n=1 Tax=Microbacterium sp. TaxID=51671 RepID=UPI00352540BC
MKAQVRPLRLGLSVRVATILFESEATVLVVGTNWCSGSSRRAPERCPLPDRGSKEQDPRGARSPRGDGRWNVIRDNADRASSVHDTQSSAEQTGRGTAKCRLPA